MSPRSPLLAALVLSACGTTADYPSLLPRAGERLGFAEPAAAPVPPAAPDPALDLRIAQARRRLGESVAAFDAAAAGADRRVNAARGAAVGSEAWLDAQVTLAELDSLRSTTLEVATELDAEATARAMSLAPDYPALDAAIVEARQASEAQTARIDTLQRLLPAG